MLALLGYWQSTNRAEDAAAGTPLENYIKGHATGKGDFMRKAFHTEGRIMAFERRDDEPHRRAVCLALDVLFQPNEQT
jgi:hypothetical protein